MYRCKRHVYSASQEWSCRDSSAEYVATCVEPHRWTVSSMTDGRIDRVCVRGTGMTAPDTLAPLLDSLRFDPKAIEQMLTLTPRGELPTHEGKLRSTRIEWGVDDVEVCWIQFFGLTD
jgi:hypothetical protein